jgi:aryl-alcohol dehydrogenase-like predicted oxidoreductase
MHQPRVDAVLVGASSLKQLQENVDAAGSPALPSEVLEACDKIWSTLRGPTPVYNR